jgi:hypothetical protein
MAVMGADNPSGALKKGRPPPPPTTKFKPVRAKTAVSPKADSSASNGTRTKAFKRPQGTVDFSLNGLAEKAAELEARRNAPRDAEAEQEAEEKKKQEREVQMTQQFVFNTGVQMFADAQRKQEEAAASALSQSNLSSSGWGDSSLGLPLVFDNPEPEKDKPAAVNDPAVTVEPKPQSQEPVKGPVVAVIPPGQQPPYCQSCTTFFSDHFI